MPQERNETVLLLPLNSTDHVLGPASVTVTVIEYGDFACPYCRAVYPAVKIFLKNFVDRVRFAFRHYPVVEVHPHAERAAESAEAASAQGKFWQMHDLLFENQQHLEDEYLRQYASQARLDLEMYEHDMNRRIHLPLVREQMNGGKQNGVRGTPTFFVNGVIEDVSFGMETLYKAIEANLQLANMYDEDSISSHKTGGMPRGTTTALSVDDEMAEVTLISLHRLQSAFVELSTALNETLRDERSNATACLQRAQAMLQGVDGTSPQPSGNGVRQGLAPWQVRRVLAHIEANLGMSIRNKDLAALARLSTFHFNVAFRNSVGNSPHEYIIRRRMERAQGLMLSTDKALSEIAAECGLADQPHFTRLFRRFVGESPAAWRRARANPSR